MRRDRKLAQKKKSRAAAQSSSRSSTASRNHDAMVRAARQSPFGPVYMTRGWRDEALPPPLVTIVMTRKLPNGLLLPQVLLIDRTCLGVKNAFVTEASSAAQIDAIVASVGESHPEGVELVEPLLAQSVLFAALDYAAALGFKPQRDFDATLVGPRPDVLVHTPLACRKRPYYCQGPDDDAERIATMLERSVGAAGYDAYGPDFSQEDDVDDDEDELEDEAAEPREDEVALRSAVDALLDALEPAESSEVDIAQAAYEKAVVGLAPGATPLDPSALARLALPLGWAAIFRPLADGTTGLERARANPRFAEHAEALAQLATTRTALLEVRSLDTDGRLAVCRDLLSGESLTLRTPPSVTRQATRWSRLFAYLTPMADGTFYLPVSALRHEWLKNLTPSDFVPRLNELLAEMGITDRVDITSPSAGLTRYAGLASGLLQRISAPTDAQRDAQQKIYMVSSDGERFELHEAELRPTRRQALALMSALEAADDFVEDDGFGWMGDTKLKVLKDERIGSIDPEEDDTFLVSANSAARFQRLLARIDVLVGSHLAPVNLTVMRPWEGSSNILPEETAETLRVVVGTSVVQPEAVKAFQQSIIDVVRDDLDAHVPSLGGRPRDLVKEDAGRLRVEAWLEGQELAGTPGGDVPAYVDLDPIRRELGMKTVS